MHNQHLIQTLIQVSHTGWNKHSTIYIAIDSATTIIITITVEKKRPETLPLQIDKNNTCQTLWISITFIFRTITIINGWIRVIILWRLFIGYCVVLFWFLFVTAFFASNRNKNLWGTCIFVHFIIKISVCVILMWTFECRRVESNMLRGTAAKFCCLLHVWQMREFYLTSCD